jgi:hypothetical protein
MDVDDESSAALPFNRRTSSGKEGYGLVTVHEPITYGLVRRGIGRFVGANHQTLSRALWLELDMDPLVESWTERYAWCLPCRASTHILRGVGLGKWRKHCSKKHGRSPCVPPTFLLHVNVHVLMM